MTIILTPSGSPAASVGVTPVVIQSAKAPVAAQGVQSRPDGLDRLLERLSAKNKKFGAKLVAARQQLAPLALSDEGDHSMVSLRMGRGLTQAQFAEAIGQKQANVSLIESGQRVNLQRETMRRMCAVLSCDMNVLDRAIEISEARYQQHLNRLEELAQAKEEPQLVRHCA